MNHKKSHIPACPLAFHSANCCCALFICSIASLSSGFSCNFLIASIRSAMAPCLLCVGNGALENNYIRKRSERLPEYQPYSFSYPFRFLHHSLQLYFRHLSHHLQLHLYHVIISAHFEGSFTSNLS